MNTADYCFYLAGLFFYLRGFVLSIKTLIREDGSNLDSLKEIVDKDLDGDGIQKVWNFFFGYMFYAWLGAGIWASEERIMFSALLIINVSYLPIRAGLIKASAIKSYLSFALIAELAIYTCIVIKNFHL